jgi:ComF family protein
LKRYYNPSGLLAKELAKFYNLAIADLLLKKHRKFDQHQLNFTERKQNIENSLVYKNSKINLKNKKILLVDDVVTTGSTANEAAKILKENGARNVEVIAIARTILSK